MSVATRSNTPDTGRSQGYGVVLGDNMFRLATAPNRKVEVVTAPLEAPRVNTAASAEDVSNEFGSRFSRADFSGGEGLRYAHRADAEPNDARRYFDSQNVAVDADGSVTLLHDPEVSDALSATGIRLAAADGSLWATNGTSTRRTDDPEASSPTWADEDPHAGEGATTVEAIVGVGTTIYAALGANGIHRKTSGGSWSDWGGAVTWSSADHMWSAKGRVYVAAGNVLYSYDTGATPTETTVLTIAVGHTFNDLCDAGSHVLVTASDGYVYAITDDGSTITVEGQTFLEGEVPHGIAATYGVVVYGTATDIPDGGVTGRLYSATLNGAALDDIDRLRVWEGDTLDRTPRVAGKDGDDVFIAVAESSTVSSLWRYDHTNAAVHRSYRHTGTGPVCRDVLTAGGRLWWVVDEVGVLRPSSDYESDGWIVTPVGDLFTAQDKAWAAISTTYAGLDSTGESIAVKYTTSPAFSSYQRVTAYTQGDRTSETELTGVKARYLAVRIDLAASSDQSTTPTLRSVSARAYPTSDELIVRFPVDVSDQLSRPGKARTNIPGRGEAVLAALQELEGKSTTCEMPDVDETLRGVVERIERPYTHMTLRGAQSMFAWVTFRGSRVSEPVSSEGLILMGTYSNSKGLMATLPTMGDAA